MHEHRIGLRSLARVFLPVLLAIAVIAPALVNTANQASAAASLHYLFGSGSATGGKTVNFRVELTEPAPAGGAVVTLATSHPAIPIPATVTVAAGQTERSFGVGTNPVTVNTNVTISATYQGVTKSRVVLIKEPVLSSLSVQTKMRAGGAGKIIARLSGRAPIGGVVVNVTSSNTAVVASPGNQTVLAGNASVTIIVNPSFQTQDVPVDFTASYDGNVITRSTIVRYYPTDDDKTATAAASATQIANQTATEVANQTATQSAIETATQGAVETATESANQTATAVSNEATQTAISNEITQTAVAAENSATAAANQTAAAVTQTAISDESTATAAANETATEEANQTATANANASATEAANQTATADANASATEAANQTATAAANETATEEANETATQVASETTATAAANETATQVAAETTATAAANETATQSAIETATQLAADTTATAISDETTATAISDEATATQVAADTTATAISDETTATAVSDEATATAAAILTATASAPTATPIPPSYTATWNSGSSVGIGNSGTVSVCASNISSSVTVYIHVVNGEDSWPQRSTSSLVFTSSGCQNVTISNGLTDRPLFGNSVTIQVRSASGGGGSLLATTGSRYFWGWIS